MNKLNKPPFPLCVFLVQCIFLPSRLLFVRGHLLLGRLSVSPGSFVWTRLSVTFPDKSSSLFREFGEPDFFSHELLLDTLETKERERVHRLR